MVKKTKTFNLTFTVEALLKSLSTGPTQVHKQMVSNKRCYEIQQQETYMYTRFKKVFNLVWLLRYPVCLRCFLQLVDSTVVSWTLICHQSHPQNPCLKLPPDHYCVTFNLAMLPSPEYEISLCQKSLLPLIITEGPDWDYSLITAPGKKNEHWLFCHLQCCSSVCRPLCLSSLEAYGSSTVFFSPFKFFFHLPNCSHFSFVIVEQFPHVR